MPSEQAYLERIVSTDPTIRDAKLRDGYYRASGMGTDDEGLDYRLGDFGPGTTCFC